MSKELEFIEKQLSSLKQSKSTPINNVQEQTQGHPPSSDINGGGIAQANVSHGLRQDYPNHYHKHPPSGQHEESSNYWQYGNYTNGGSPSFQSQPYEAQQPPNHQRMEQQSSGNYSNQYLYQQQQQQQQHNYHPYNHQQQNQGYQYPHHQQQQQHPTPQLPQRQGINSQQKSFETSHPHNYHYHAVPNTLYQHQGSHPQYSVSPPPNNTSPSPTYTKHGYPISSSLPASSIASPRTNSPLLNSSYPQPSYPQSYPRILPQTTNNTSNHGTGSPSPLLPTNEIEYTQKLQQNTPLGYQNHHISQEQQQQHYQQIYRSSNNTSVSPTTLSHHSGRNNSQQISSQQEQQRTIHNQGSPSPTSSIQPSKYIAMNTLQHQQEISLQRPQLPQNHLHNPLARQQGTDYNHYIEHGHQQQWQNQQYQQYQQQQEQKNIANISYQQHQQQQQHYDERSPYLSSTEAQSQMKHFVQSNTFPSHESVENRNDTNYQQNVPVLHPQAIHAAKSEHPQIIPPIQNKDSTNNMNRTIFSENSSFSQDSKTNIDSNTIKKESVGNDQDDDNDFGDFQTAFDEESDERQTSNTSIQDDTSNTKIFKFEKNSQEPLQFGDYRASQIASNEVQPKQHDIHKNAKIVQHKSSDDLFDFGDDDDDKTVSLPEQENKQAPIRQHPQEETQLNDKEEFGEFEKATEDQDFEAEFPPENQVKEMQQKDPIKINEEPKIDRKKAILDAFLVQPPPSVTTPPITATTDDSHSQSKEKSSVGQENEEIQKEEETENWGNFQQSQDKFEVSFEEEEGQQQQQSSQLQDIPEKAISFPSPKEQPSQSTPLKPESIKQVTQQIDDDIFSFEEVISTPSVSIAGSSTDNVQQETNLINEGKGNNKNQSPISEANVAEEWEAEFEGASEEFKEENKKITHQETSLKSEIKQEKSVQSTFHETNATEEEWEAEFEGASGDFEENMNDNDFQSPEGLVSKNSVSAQNISVPVKSFENSVSSSNMNEKGTETETNSSKQTAKSKIINTMDILSFFDSDPTPITSPGIPSPEEEKKQQQETNRNQEGAVDKDGDDNNDFEVNEDEWGDFSSGNEDVQNNSSTQKMIQKQNSKHIQQNLELKLVLQERFDDLLVFMSENNHECERMNRERLDVIIHRDLKSLVQCFVPAEAGDHFLDMYDDCPFKLVEQVNEESKNWKNSTRHAANKLFEEYAPTVRILIQGLQEMETAYQFIETIRQQNQKEVVEAVFNDEKTKIFFGGIAEIELIMQGCILLMKKDRKCTKPVHSFLSLLEIKISNFKSLCHKYLIRLGLQFHTSLPSELPENECPLCAKHLSLENTLEGWEKKVDIKCANFWINRISKNPPSLGE